MARREESYFFFLVVFFADDFLVVFLAAFLAMALSPPFFAQTLMRWEKRVNGFLRCAHFFCVGAAARFAHRAATGSHREVEPRSHEEHEATFDV